MECTLVGPTLRFHDHSVIALIGAPSPATLDGERVPFWKPVLVKAGQPVIIVEAMKMELAVPAPVSGTLTAIRCRPGMAVNAGDTLAVIEPGG